MGQPVELEGRVTPEDSFRHPYLYLPFDLPEGTTRVDVRLEHDPGNVIDLGLLDPHAGDFPSANGFRGWSGGARDRFFVASDEATPGYLPGEMPPGEWQVILGLYRIRSEGCSYRVIATLSDGPRPVIEPPSPHPSFPVTPGWYPGDLQSHTHHSDAKGSLDDLMAAARDRGLQFLAVTDHNTISHHRQLAQRSSHDLFLLPGEEVTTGKGHANVWGAQGWVDFRIIEESHVDKVVERAHVLGGVVSLNHPKRGGPAWQYHVPEGVDCVEAWQAPWPAGNDESLDFYDWLLREGRRPVLVGGSDRHQPGWPDPDPIELRVGSPTTWLWLDELSVAACLQALRSGRVFVSQGPEGPRLELTLEGVPMGGMFVPPLRTDSVSVSVSVESGEELHLRLVGGDGILFERRLSSGVNRVEHQIDRKAAGTFVRAELRHADSGHVVALSNPVFIAG